MGFFRNKLLGINSRKQRRHPICVLVEEPGKRQDYLDKTYDISQNGMFVVTDHLREKGEDLQIRFALPGRPPITLGGRVARIAKSGPFSKKGKEGMGIIFTEIDPQSRRILEDFVKI